MGRKGTTRSVPDEVWKIILGRKHGRTGTREYKSWLGMLQRCHNPRDRSYKDYGGRGIRVCEAWKTSFVTFFQALGPRPEGFELDRINPNGHYEPGNVRWIKCGTGSRRDRLRPTDDIWKLIAS